MQYNYRLIWKIVEREGRQCCVGSLLDEVVSFGLLAGVC